MTLYKKTAFLSTALMTLLFPRTVLADNTEHLRHYESVFVEVEMPEGSISRGLFLPSYGESELRSETIGFLQSQGIPISSSASGSNVVRLNLWLDYNDSIGEIAIFSCDVEANLDLNIRGDLVNVSFLIYQSYGKTPSEYLFEDTTTACTNALSNFITDWQSTH